LEKPILNFFIKGVGVLQKKYNIFRKGGFVSGNRCMEVKRLFTKDIIIQYRFNMVAYALKHNISKKAVEFKTTRKTVRKWVDSYKKDHENRLRNKSRLNQKHPNKFPDVVLEGIIQYRKRTQLGAYYIKDNLDLKCSQKTIHKKIKQAGLLVKNKSKYKKKRDMNAFREKYKPLEKRRIDVKYLTDIPKYQITVRDYRNGSTFIGFTNHKDSTSIGIFTEYLISSLKSRGVEISNTHFQSDNGSEFRNISKKAGKKSMFEEIIERNNLNNIYNPPVSPTLNSDVESFHERIEKELYNIENYESESHFYYKTNAYLMWYNIFRKNRNKGHKSPLMILKVHNIENAKKIVTIPPIFVDNYVKDIILIKQGGYLKWLSPNDFHIPS
jgi:hypothetical protein